MKKIGFDNELIKQSVFKKVIKDKLFPFLSTNHDLVISCSNYDRDIFSSAFSVDKSKIVVTGYPRNDSLFKNKKINLNNKKLSIAYLPTFRGEVYSEFCIFKETGFDIDEWAAFLDGINAELIIKLHPVQNISIEEKNDFLKYPCFDLKTKEEDIYEFIDGVDIFIIDYSSIYFDLLFLDKKFLMAPLDIAQYMQKDREFYLPYESYVPGKTCSNWSDVKEGILHFMQEDINPDVEEYEILRNKFFNKIDAESSSRVFHEINKRFIL